MVTHAPARRPGARRDQILVWIDSREAFIVRSTDTDGAAEHLVSDVPPHTRGIGHIRRDPTVRHGGGEAQDASDRRREAYLTAFLDTVAGRLADDADLWVIGPGPVHEKLARLLRSTDVRRRRDRTVTAAASTRLSVPQLGARLREVMPAQ